MLKVVQIVPDDRDMFRNYDKAEPYFGAAPTALFEGFSKWEGSIEIHVISCVRKRMSAPTKLADNIFYHQVLVSGGYRRTLFVEAIRKVRKKIREINPDFVNGHGTEDYPGICAAYSGFPNSITLHGNMRAVARRLKYRPFLQMSITALAESVALSKTDAVICNSSYTERCVGKLNEKKVRIPNAVRSVFFSVKNQLMNDSCRMGDGHRRVAALDSPQLPIDEGSISLTSDLRLQTSSVPVLLCIGEVISYKNQIGLIHALDALASDEMFRLAFVGRCNMKSAYGKSFLTEISQREWCEYSEPVGEESLRRMLSSSCGLIHPTLEDSFGLVVAEAQVLGVPVAASSIGGIVDLIDNGHTGFLFYVQDSIDICEKVRLLLSPNRLSTIVRNATIFARKHYAPDHIAEAHLQFYAAMIG